MKKLTLKAVFDADLDELVKLHLTRVERSSLEGFYVSVVRHYLENHPVLLEKALARIPSLGFGPVGGLVAALTAARLEITGGKVSPACFERLLGYLHEFPEWDGELLFVLALCFETNGDRHEMSRAYLSSAEAFRAQGVSTKAVRALLNHVAAESQLHGERSYLSEYNHVFREAMKVKAHSTAAVARLNASYEYAGNGAWRVALSYVNRALALLSRQKGSRSWFLALAHRAHVLHELGREEEGRHDYEELRLCRQWDLAGVRESLDRIYGSRAEAPSAPMPDSWKKKAAGAGAPLGEIEEKLLRFLEDGPKEKGEILSHLYGDRLSWETLTNRFNNTLVRIRKKQPGLVVFEAGRYRLAEKLLPARLRRA